MDANNLAKLMRERALLIEGTEDFDESSIRDFSKQKLEREKKLKRVEDFKKLYFNAGRWVGGARDHSAREAFTRMREIEARENR